MWIALVDISLPSALRFWLVNHHRCVTANHMCTSSSSLLSRAVTLCLRLLPSCSASSLTGTKIIYNCPYSNPCRVSNSRERLVRRPGTETKTQSILPQSRKCFRMPLIKEDLAVWLSMSLVHEYSVIPTAAMY